MSLTGDVVNHAITYMLASPDNSTAVARLAADLGVSKAEAKSLVAKAKKRLASKAARANIAVEVGAALERLNGLYTLAVTSGNIAKAVTIMRERSRWLQLAGTLAQLDDTASAATASQVEAACAQLAPLFPSAPPKDIVALCCRASLEIVKLRSMLASRGQHAADTDDEDTISG